MTAFLFAGQGSQAVGMLDDCRPDDPAVRAILARAEARLGLPLAELMTRGPAEVLARTAVAQPALLAVGVLHASRLRAAGIEPRALIGHSVGQYAALVIAGALTFEAALGLVQARARLMAAATPPEGVAMLAVLGTDRARVYEACRVATPAGVVDVACHNAPGETVVSGTRAAVDAVADHLEDAVAVVPLVVSVAAHCRLLRAAAAEFAPLVARCAVRAPRVPVLDNVTARPLADADAVRRSLVDQLTAPVLFEESVAAVREAGVSRFVQCGPGDVLVRCVRRQAAAAECLAFREAIAAVAGVA